MCYVNEISFNNLYEESDDESPYYDTSDDESDDGYEYSNLGFNSSYTDSIIVRTPRGNGNHTATIQLTNGKYYYREYGDNPIMQYKGNKLEYDDEYYRFNIIEERINNAM